MKRILVTGGAGFIGSNYIRNKISDKNSEIINLDALTYAANLHNVDDFPNNHIFVKGNICDRRFLEDLFSQYAFDSVINFAAESHVDRSISDPSVFVKTNVLGTQTLLDVCRKMWSVDSSDSRCTEYVKGKRYVQISTDEVYGSLGKDGKFTERTPISPNSPYSSSKAGADLLVNAYHRTYGFPAVITRCSNNYGPNQFPEKLIPLVISNALSNKAIPVYGNGLQIRDWIYVTDHCSGIDTVLEKGECGEAYNIGSNNEWTNIDIIRKILEELDKPDSLIAHVPDRLGHDVRYAMDSGKIETELGWKHKIDFDKGIKITIDWYLNNQGWLENIRTGEYLRYGERFDNRK